MIVEGHDRKCHFCNKPCNAIAEDPGLWPVPLHYPDELERDIKWHHSKCVMERLDELDRLRKENEELVKPTPMYLTCPKCHDRHIDKGEFATRPHHTHACQGCGLVWRPALVPTVGVEFLPGFNGASESIEASCRGARVAVVRRPERKRIAESVGRWFTAKAKYLSEDDRDLEGAIRMIVGDLMNGEWEEDTLGGTVEGNP